METKPSPLGKVARRSRDGRGQYAFALMRAVLQDGAATSSVKNRRFLPASPKGKPRALPRQCVKFQFVNLDAFHKHTRFLAETQPENGFSALCQILRKTQKNLLTLTPPCVRMILPVKKGLFFCAFFSPGVGICSAHCLNFITSRGDTGRQYFKEVPLCA